MKNYVMPEFVELDINETEQINNQSVSETDCWGWGWGWGHKKEEEKSGECCCPKLDPKPGKFWWWCR